MIRQMNLERWANLSPSSIYNALNRLAGKGAVSITTEREGRAPERTVYHITERGRAMLADLLREALSAVGPDGYLFYIGLAFAESLPPEEIIELLAHRRERLQHAVHQMSRQEKEISENRPDLVHVLMMIEAGRRHLELDIEMVGRLTDLFHARPDYFERLGGKIHEW
jgi:DNA-binding PadR family transcriptional regulator